MYQVQLLRGKNSLTFKAKFTKISENFVKWLWSMRKKINIICISSFVNIWGALVSGRGRYLSNWWSKNTEESDKYFTRKTASTHATELLNTIATSYSVYRVQRASTVWNYITRIRLKFSYACWYSFWTDFYFLVNTKIQWIWYQCPRAVLLKNVGK